MESRLKIGAMIVGITLGLSGCAQDLAKFNQDLANLNATLAGKGVGGASTGGFAMAAQPEASQRKPVQMTVPNDKRVATAIDEALPAIKKVLGIHQCIKDYDSLRLLNVYAVPGVNMTHVIGGYGFPNNIGLMKYHDQNKCVSVRAIDQWTMPALNALQFRAVYFADDSGETVNFQYLFKKSDDGIWKIAETRCNC